VSRSGVGRNCGARGAGLVEVGDGEVVRSQVVGLTHAVADASEGPPFED
jgi:hypothetical protein